MKPYTIILVQLANLNFQNEIGKVHSIIIRINLFSNKETSMTILDAERLVHDLSVKHYSDIKE